MPQDFHMKEPRITNRHGWYRQSGTPAGVVETESVSNSMGRRLVVAYSKLRSEPSKNLSAVDTVPIQSGSNSLRFRQQQRFHRPNPRSPDEQVVLPYADITQSRKLGGGSEIFQERGLSHEKVPGQPHSDVVEGWPEYPASDGQGQQFPSTGTPKPLNNMTQDIDWQALNQKTGAYD